MGLSLPLLILMLFSASAKEEKYTSKWDHINVDEILKSDRLLENYKKCLMDQGKCSPEGSDLKKILPDALQNECSRCTDKQKENTEKVVNYMMDNKKVWFEELQKKYDPSGKYLEQRMKKKNSNEVKKEKAAF